jgi:hypothetical protein
MRDTGGRAVATSKSTTTARVLGQSISKEKDAVEDSSGWGDEKTTGDAK